MNHKETLDRLISLAERQIEELDPDGRKLAVIEFEDGLPQELIDARVMLGMMK